MEIERIKSLVDLMVENDLTRVEIHEGETHILLKRGDAPAYAPPPAVQPLAAPPASMATSAPAGLSAEADSGLVIRSPMVGTFYTAPDPESPSFIKIGDSVGPETVVCLVEAMKVFNEIKAEVSGRIVKLLVGNGDAVEFDQPLFAVEPA